MVEVADLRVGVEAVEEHGQNGAFSGRRWCEDALESEVVGGLAELLALGSVVGPQVKITELEGCAGGRITQVKDSGQRYVVAVHAPGKEVLWGAALSFGEPVELTDRCLAIEREIEGGEAVRWVPASTVGSGTGSGERMAIVGDVPERPPGEGGRLDRVDSSEELLVDHARLDENALGHCVDGAQDASELAGAQEVDRLVVVERIVGREQPVVGRFGT